LFCLTLRWSGARISEVLALTPAAIDIASGVSSIQTLKRRRRGVIRQVPLPVDSLDDLQVVFGLTIAQHGPELAKQAPLALQPHDSIAIRQSCHGDRRHRWNTRHAEGLAARVRRECLSV
jgi:integrase